MPRKPTKATLRTVELLRDRVAAFCAEHGGVCVTARVEWTDVTFGATWRLETPIGPWFVHEPSDPMGDHTVLLNTRFDDPQRARMPDMNPYSGKWNHAFDVADADTFLADFVCRVSAFLSPAPGVPS